MVCPKCGGKTTVFNNCFNPETNEEYRRRRCKTCNYTFFTMEFEVEYTRQFDKDWVKHHRCTAYNEKRRNERHAKRS